MPRPTESEPDIMLFSHAVKRFFLLFLVAAHLSVPPTWLFLWRLTLQAPDLVVLGIDTMVMVNDGARGRHGVKPTDMRVKGFQPLQMTWRNSVIDAVFRRGDAHSNNGDTVAQMVCHVVGKIRKHYRPDVGIIVRMDSGFFDQKHFEVSENLGIGYICGGKLKESVKELVGQSESNEAAWGRYE